LSTKNSARGHPGGAAPDVNLGPTNFSETTRARKFISKTPFDMVKYLLWVQRAQGLI